MACGGCGQRRAKVLAEGGETPAPAPVAVGLRGVGAQEQYKAARAKWAASKWERQTA